MCNHPKVHQLLEESIKIGILTNKKTLFQFFLGSTVDREASQKEREKDQPTFKDNDFLKDGVKIHIGEEAKAKLMETLKG